MQRVLRQLGPRKILRYAFGQMQASIIDNRFVLAPVRIAFLRLFGATIGRETVAEPMSFINLYRTGFYGLKLGNCVYIGQECMFDLADRIECEDYVSIGPRVTIITHHNLGYDDHPLRPHFPGMQKPVLLKRGCFIGANTTILAGVTVGARAVVGAGSLVRQDVPAGSVVAGVPAKIVRHIDDAPSGYVEVSKAL